MIECSGFGLGIFFIVIVAVIWAGASVLTQYVYSDLDFKSPFLVTYLSTGLFALYLPLWKLWVALGYVEDPPWRLDPADYSKALTRNKQTRPLIASNGHTSIPNSITYQAEGRSVPTTAEVSSDSGEESDDQDSSVGSEREPYSHLDVVKIAWVVFPLWFMANFTYNYSLLLTSVGSSTIISNLSGSFTLLFSYMAGIEVITYGKITGLLVSLGGVALIGVQDHDNGSTRTFEGDCVAFFAAAAYGLYTTAIKLKIPEDDGVSMQLLFGYVGLLTAVTLSPILFLLGALHLGNLHELTGRIFGFLLLGSIFNNVISDYLWARSVVLTTPTIATVGLSITIPFALISDYVFFGKIPTGMSVSGALLVIGGFVLVSCEQSIRKWLVHTFPSFSWIQTPGREENEAVARTRC